MGIMIRIIVIAVVSALFSVSPLYAKNETIPPKEHGVYVKTTSSLSRILPNIVHDEEEIIFIEANNPPKFALKDVEYLVIYGQYDMDVLTMNPLLFLAPSPFGKIRFIFGKDIEIDVADKGKDLYIIKPKGLFGRGYYCLWIEDSAWDFIIE